MNILGRILDFIQMRMDKVLSMHVLFTVANGLPIVHCYTAFTACQLVCVTPVSCTILNALTSPIPLGFQMTPPIHRGHNWTHKMLLLSASERQGICHTLEYVLLNMKSASAK